MQPLQRLFMVFGLHRSGTSATAGTLHHLGVNMGKHLIGVHESNKKGHFEDKAFVDLNDKILRSAGGAWDNPPTREQMSQLNFPKQPIEGFLRAARRPLWGLKDPRILLTYEVWRPYFGQHEAVTYVFVRRPFEASVSSLMRRNGFPKAKAVNILNTYQENMNYYQEDLKKNKEDILEIEYEELLHEPGLFVAEVNRRLGRDEGAGLDGVRNFLDKRLKHF